jgi:hypothetical protein
MRKGVGVPGKFEAAPKAIEWHQIKVGAWARNKDSCGYDWPRSGGQGYRLFGLSVNTLLVFQ